VRHDLLGDAAGIARVGNTLCRIIEDILAAEEKGSDQEKGSDHNFG
jgi:hypothetical protein